MTGGLRLALSPAISVAVNDSYDNVFENIASLSFSYSFGSQDNDNLYSSDVHDRLLAPNVRHIGIVDTGAGQMAQQGYNNLGSGSEAVQFGDVFYFDPTLPESSSQIVGAGGLGVIAPGQCTAQHPCGDSQFDQATINQLDVDAPNTNFFLSTGTFSATGGLTFHEGQNIYGWDAGFLTPASGSNRPLINDSVTFDGGNNIMEDMQVRGQTDARTSISGVFTFGVYVSSGAVGNVQIANSNIVVDTTTGPSSSNSAVINNSAANLAISGSSIADQFIGSSSVYTVYGINNYGAGTISVDDSTINVVAGGSALPAGFGVYAQGGHVLIDNSSTLSVNSNYQSIGLSGSGGGSIAFDNSSMALTKSGMIAYPSAQSVGAVSFSNSLCTIDGVGPTAC